jgi:hypothetical protein
VRGVFHFCLRYLYCGWYYELSVSEIVANFSKQSMPNVIIVCPFVFMRKSVSNDFLVVAILSVLVVTIT